MFKIIGGDQKEYGPVSFDQLAQWIRDNRANAQTLVQKEGGPWVPLGSVPEFASMFAELQRPITPAPAATGIPAVVPLPSAYPPGPTLADPERARQLVQGPATGLLVAGVLCLICALIGLVGNFFGASFRPPRGDIPQELRPMFDMIEQMQGPMAIISSLIGLVISGLVIFAAQKMRVLESFGLVVTATVLAAIPCTSPCCCIGLPIGIWVLTVLFKPEVKSAFR